MHRVRLARALVERGQLQRRCLSMVRSSQRRRRLSAAQVWAAASTIACSSSGRRRSRSTAAEVEAAAARRLIAGAIAGVAEAAALAVVLETELKLGELSQKSHALKLQYLALLRVRYRQKTGVHRWRGMSSVSDGGSAAQMGAAVKAAAGVERAEEARARARAVVAETEATATAMGPAGGGGGGGGEGRRWAAAATFGRTYVRHLHLEQWNFCTSRRTSRTPAACTCKRRRSHALHLQSLQWWWAYSLLQNLSHEALAQ